VACPVDCIALQQATREDGRWYPEFFRINFSRCIMCGFCEEACPTNAIQLTPDFEMCEYDRSNMVYEKEHLQIDGTGKYHDYNFYRVAGLPSPARTRARRERGPAHRREEPAAVIELLFFYRTAAGLIVPSWR
jgi:NADH-quinone oxidoreductase subunit I